MPSSSLEIDSPLHCATSLNLNTHRRLHGRAPTSKNASKEKSPLLGTNGIEAVLMFNLYKTVYLLSLHTINDPSAR